MRPLLCALATALAAAVAEAASPACAAAMRGVFGKPPTAPVNSAAQEFCVLKLFQSEMALRKAGCNTEDQGYFCSGQTQADRGASGPPHANIPNPGIGGGIPKEIDCPVRELAWRFAQKLQGSQRGAALKAVHDALQLDTDCGHAFVAPIKGTSDEDAAQARAQWIAEAHKTVLHVRANEGLTTGSGDGSQASPLGSVEEAARRASLLPPAQRPAAIVLGGGNHVLEATLELGPEHSNITFVSAPGEQAVVTGAVPLSLKWSPFDHSQGKNIFVADVPPSVDDIPGLRVNGGRAIRARYPNSNPEEQQDTCDQGKTSKEGCPYIMAFQEPQRWLPPKDQTYAPSRTVTITSPDRYDVAPEFGIYAIGTGGACSVYSPPESYWCSNHTSGGGAFTFRTPSGLQFTEGTFPNAAKWSDPVGDGAEINIWRPSRWSNWGFKWESYDRDTRTITFGEGGFQGARGSDDGGDFYIENVREELDSPSEFFFDAKAHKLYYYHNASSGTPIPSTFRFEATRLKTIVSHIGTQDKPVAGIKHVGVTFTGSRTQFFDPHGVPSGGDWALQRDAALFFEGTSGMSMRECTVTRVDGNAVMLSGFNRGAVIADNEFTWIGDSVIASWGHTKEVDGVEGNDGTNGEQPRGTQIVRNLVHENGFFSKQASPYFQAKAAQTLLADNIFFNGPRAGVNINDGFGTAPSAACFGFVAFPRGEGSDPSLLFRGRQRAQVELDLQLLPRV